MPLLETKGAGSAQGFGLSLGSAESVYIEDVFSTYVYAGNSSTQTITNGIDLAGEGGLVWVKGRNVALSHYLGSPQVTRELSSNAGGTGESSGTMFNAYNSNGFTLQSSAGVNSSSYNYVSWTFRKQPKFFDIVTYTGNGSNRTIAHDLGSVPGCVIVKRTDTTGDWKIYHLGLTSAAYAIDLNNNGNSEQLETTVWNSTAPTSTVFSVGTATSVNASGGTYVAYIFAHNEGGFGLSGTDNVISCGTYNGTGGSSATTVSLGFEPQFVFISNRTYGTQNLIFDSMRGITTGGVDPTLTPATLSAENGAAGSANLIDLNATGFTITATGYDVTDRSGSTYIYIAIRRGPMKVPTSGTSVFTPSLASVNTNISVGFPADLWIGNDTSGDGGNSAHIFSPRLLGTKYLQSATTSDELGGGAGLWYWDRQNNFLQTNFGGSRAEYLLRRAPGFFDVVCYTGNGVSGRTLNHNLTVTPELLIIKSRNITNTWNVQTVAAGWNKFGYLSSDQAFGTDSFLTADPTSTALFLQSFAQVNGSGNTYVAYLFATVAGVSKVGSYTGTGTTQTINCGFTAGSRFVMIKRTDSTGDWYVWDSARGIVAGNDPYLLLNSTAAEVTNTDYVDTASTGFEISSTAPAAINANGGSFIFLAIA